MIGKLFSFTHEKPNDMFAVFLKEFCSMRFRRYPVAVAVFVLGLSGFGLPVASVKQTQHAQADSALRELSNIIRNLPNSDVKSQALENIDWFLSKSPDWPAETNFQSFASDITLDAALLARRDQTPPRPIGDRLAIVNKDLTLKRNQCRQLGGPKPVTIMVTTRNSVNDEVKGYEVWYVKKGYEDKATEFKRFEANSSPTPHKFDQAGYYVLWTAGPNRQGRRIDMEIGPDTQARIDLPIPQ
jgi:hypothetical protein